MLEFFRKYQKQFFFIVALFTVSSFIFFGAFSTFGGAPVERPDRVAAHAFDGSPLMLSELENLSRFLAADRDDAIPNLCNDGVIRADFLEGKLSDLLQSTYFDALKGDLEVRLDKVKRYTPYVHPQAPFLNARAVWQRGAPQINEELDAIAKESVSTAFFSRLSRLYQLQRHFPPSILKRILYYQHQQMPNLPGDPRFMQGDLALFGFRTTLDWFGRDFLDLSAQFIMNASRFAESKGYRVSMQEAKGDLLNTFRESVQRIRKEGAPFEMNFSQYLRSLGFDEASACKVWQKVLLFRRYFQDVGSCAFMDSLPFKEFGAYAKEQAVVQLYKFPIRLRTAQDVAEYKLYSKAIGKKVASNRPVAFYTIAEVEKNYPDLVEEKWKGQVAEVSKKAIGLNASLKEVRDWAFAEPNWQKLQKEFSFGFAATREERFLSLEQLPAEKQAAFDAYVRNQLVDENPEWVESALARAPLEERTWAISGGSEPFLKKEGVYYRIENLEKIAEKKILSFDEARSALARLVDEEKGEYANPLLNSMKEALTDLKKDPFDPDWVQNNADPIADQFKLSSSIQEVQRTSKERWMKAQAFSLPANSWSSVELTEEGEIAFFCLKEKKKIDPPISEQISFGKASLSHEARQFAASKLLEKIISTQSIVTPLTRSPE